MVRRMTVRLDEEDDAELIERLDALSEDRDRSLAYLLKEAAESHYLDSDRDGAMRDDAERTESARSDSDRVDALERRVNALETIVGTPEASTEPTEDVWESEAERVRGLDTFDADEEPERLDHVAVELKQAVENVDWDDVDVSRTDGRVVALTKVLARIREHGGTSVAAADLHDVLDDHDGVDLAASTQKRMLSDVLSQVDAVDGGGRGSHGYRWVDDEDESDA